MEITKKPKIKSIPYDEFIDNESLEKLVKELNAGGANVALGVLDDFINWAIPALASRKESDFPDRPLWLHYRE